MKSIDQIVSDFRLSISDKDDSKEKVQLILEFVTNYFDTVGKHATLLLEESLRISIKINYTGGEILSRLNFLYAYFINNNFSKMEEQSRLVFPQLEKIKDEYIDYSFALNLVAYDHWFKGEFDKGFDKIFEALKFIDKIKGDKAEGWIYYALGVFYFDTSDFANSELHYSKAFQSFDALNYQYGIARSKTGIASSKIRQQKTGDASLLLQDAIIIYRNGNYYAGLARALNDLALIEKANNNHDRTIALFNESIVIRKEINHLQGLITTHTELGEIYFNSEDYEKSLENLLEGLSYSNLINAKYKSIRLHKLLSDVYKKRNEIPLAFDHFEKFHYLKAEVLGEESAQNIRKLQSKFETEKSEKEAEIERLKNVELKNANALISEKNKEITDSINYAKRIQTAILPSDEDLKKCFENYFVLYKPKDIVSGDFYWSVNATSSKTGINVSIIAAIDCTGHGVPGAIMSMLGNTLLNQTIINPKVIYPSDVLDFLNKELPYNLKSSGQESSIRDGMDMALCSFDWKNKIMYFSGANNPCWIIRDHGLIELKGDKQAISASTDMEKRNFINQEFALQKNDLVYLFTDGYADQFGGAKGKKFKYKQLKELLIKNSALSMNEQHSVLADAFENWKGNLEQVDDVLVIGIKI